MQKTAVVLINLGTPEAPTEEAVREYLREFLSDPRVVTIPRFIWWFILNFIVLKKRPAISAKAYQAIWTDQGSPLMSNSKAIRDGLQNQADQQAAGEYEFTLAMRYGQPSISSAIEKIKQQGADKLIVLPLYPQYATSSTGTALEAFKQGYESWPDAPTSHSVVEYHADQAYIAALADSIQRSWADHGRAECLLMSFHGVPERTITEGDPYLAQCRQTAQLLADKLALKPAQWRLVFQSRFGRAKWIQPYCVETLQRLPQEGISSVDVVCPGFAADCLETLEEMALQNREVFMQAGGEGYRYIPALNDDVKHIGALFALVASHNDKSHKQESA